MMLSYGFILHLFKLLIYIILSFVVHQIVKKVLQELQYILPERRYIFQ